MDLRILPIYSKNQIESRLLKLAALFLFINSLALMLSPAVRSRSWQSVFRWDHWLGFAIWLIMFILAHLQAERYLPGRDPYLLPIGALLSGWGILMTWRLLPEFGMRQSLWLVLAVGLMILIIRLPGDLSFLQQYKYIWLFSSLLVVALTLVLGTNPMGYGPPMWLGCCGIYLQPSEPLKLLLIAYLAGYMADRLPYLQLTRPDSTGFSPTKFRLLPLLIPTLIMTGLAMALFMVQRDLGTATIFLLLYAVIVYITTGRKRILGIGMITLAIAGLVGYWFFDVVRIRIDSWLNPWLDPSGRSYQIVQSLMAIANGGLLGRGPGLGNPGLVPVAHSDLIFSAIAEEFGTISIIALLILISLVASRGLMIAFRSEDTYRRYLAAGLVTLLVGQSLLIIGGSLKLVPLTGVTLPFVSYGGSSLVVSYLCLALLLKISNRANSTPAVLHNHRPYLQLGGFLLVGIAMAALAAGWWAIYRGPSLLSRTDNPRRAISDRSVLRGSILDRNNQAINLSVGSPGDYERLYSYPDLGNIIGYNDPTYGQSGLEASLDDTLRGLKGNPGLSIWWNHLLYGQPPPGLDVRLSLDLKLQKLIDDALRGHRGAMVVLNAESGEILGMASHPTFDANQLENTWEHLIKDSHAPLYNRASLGRYPVGELESLLPNFDESGISPTPPMRLPTGDFPGEEKKLNRSPLQMALATAIISSGGIRPPPQIVTAINTSQAGWVLLSPLAKPLQVLDPDDAEKIADRHAIPELGIWQKVSVIKDLNDQEITWYLGGSMPTGGGNHYAVAVILEESNPNLVEEIGQKVLELLNPPP